MKKLFIFIALIAIAIALAGVYKFNLTNDDIYVEQPNGAIVPYDESTTGIASSFEECAALGYVIMESYPEQCSDGVHTFTRIIPEGEDMMHPNVQIANPASENCINLGGSLEIKTIEDGGQYGECTLPSGAVCEEWTLFRGECDK